jgi:hypothetical protein
VHTVRLAIKNRGISKHNLTQIVITLVLVLSLLRLGLSILRSVDAGSIDTAAAHAVEVSLAFAPFVIQYWAYLLVALNLISVAKAKIRSVVCNSSPITGPPSLRHFFNICHVKQVTMLDGPRKILYLSIQIIFTLVIVVAAVTGSVLPNESIRELILIVGGVSTGAASLSVSVVSVISGIYMLKIFRKLQDVLRNTDPSQGSADSAGSRVKILVDPKEKLQKAYRLQKASRRIIVYLCFVTVSDLLL